MIVLEILFWFCIFLLFHSYVLFPAYLALFSKFKKQNELVYSPEDKWPKLSILMSAYNEEKVLPRKLESLEKSRYPGEMELLVASDASSDKTAELIKEYDRQKDNVSVFIYEERQGKVKIINQLADKADGEILIITDANVFLEPNTIEILVSHFKDEAIGLVDTQMVNTGQHRGGISLQESAYIGREVRIKYREGILWGAMMGPFGGCYAVRKKLFKPVPENFLVDDFYVNMLVFEQGFKSINEPRAIVLEDVSNDLWEEFRRKTRIATGNFQNTRRFLHLMRLGPKGVAFCFFSHKLIRWSGPFLLILILVLNLLILRQREIYEWTMAFQIVLLLLPLIDAFLRLFNLHSVILRFATHFYTMNLALLAGFFKFIKGVKTNVWKPTRRNQTN